MQELLDKFIPVQFPLLGNSLIVGMVSLFHISFASLAVGYMILAPIVEALGRSRPLYVDAAHTMTRFTLVTFTVSLVLAVIMVELFIGLFPLTNSLLFNRFRYPIYAAVAAFLLQLFLLYPYYHYWEAIRSRSIRLHITLGALAAVLVLIWVGVLDGIGSYMLTPVKGEGKWADLLNPTWLPLVIHRFGGNLVLAGYVLAGYAGWRLGNVVQQTNEIYYLHLLRAGLLIGLITLLFQPVTGLLYATAIEQTVPDAYRQLVQGPYQGLVFLQFSLIGLLFFGTHLWLQSARSGSIAAVRREVPLVWSASLAILMVVFVGQPGIRRLFTFLLVASTIVLLYVRRDLFWEKDTRPFRRPLIRGLSIALAVVALMTYLTMGTIRETARRPDTVRGLISLHDESRTPAAYRQEQ